MGGKMGKRPTGRKPESVRRQSSKTTGASGKETAGEVVTGDSNRNIDKATRTKSTGGTGSGE